MQISARLPLNIKAIEPDTFLSIPVRKFVIPAATTTLPASNTVEYNAVWQSISDVIEDTGFFVEMGRGIAVFGSAIAVSAALASAPVTVPALVTLGLAGLAGAALNTLSAAAIDAIHIGSGHQSRARYDLMHEAGWGFLYGLTAGPTMAFVETAASLVSRIIYSAGSQAGVEIFGTVAEGALTKQDTNVILGRALGAGLTAALFSGLFEGASHAAGQAFRKLAADMAVFLREGQPSHGLVWAPLTEGLPITVSPITTLTTPAPRGGGQGRKKIPQVKTNQPKAKKGSSACNKLLTDLRPTPLYAEPGIDFIQFNRRYPHNTTNASQSIKRILAEIWAIRTAYFSTPAAIPRLPITQFSNRATAAATQIIQIVSAESIIKNYPTLRGLLLNLGFRDEQLTPVIHATLSDIFPYRWDFLKHQFYIDPSLIDPFTSHAPVNPLNDGELFSPKLPNNLARMWYGSRPVAPDGSLVELHYLVNPRSSVLITAPQTLRKGAGIFWQPEDHLAHMSAKQIYEDTIFKMIRRVFWAHYAQFANYSAYRAPLPFDVMLDFSGDMTHIKATI